MKIIYYEFKKLWNNRQFWMIIFLTFLIGLSAVNIYELRNDKPEVKYYKEHQQVTKYFDDNSEDKYNKLNSYLELLIIYENLEQEINYSQIIPDYDVTYSSQELESYENFTPIFLDNIPQEKEMILSYINNLTQLLSYDEYVEEVVEQSLALKGQPAYQQYLEWQKDALSIMGETYQRLESTQIEDTSYLAVERLEENPFIIYTKLVFLIFLALLIFNEDQSQLILSTPKGRGISLGAKLFVFIVVMNLVSISFSIMNFMIFMLRYGSVNLNLPLQNVLAFYESPFKINILTYFILKTFYNIFMYGSILIIFLSLKTIVRNSKITLFIFLTYLAISGTMYYLIPPFSSMSIFKYINTFASINFKELTQTFTYFPMFSILIFKYQALVALILITLSVGLLIIYKNNYISQERSLNIQVLPDAFKARVLSKTKLLYYEMIKVFVIRKGVIFLILLLLYNGFMIKDIFDYGLNEHEQAKQLIYLSLQDKSDSEIDKYFSDVLLEYNEQKETFEKLRFKADLTTEEIVFMTDYLNSTPHYRQVEAIYDQYIAVDYQLVYPSGYRILISEDTYQKEILNSIALMLFVFIVFGGIFNEDQKNNQEILYRATYRGNRQRRNAKLILVFISVSLLYIVLNASEYFAYNHFYPMTQNGHTLKAIVNLNQDSMAPLFKQYPQLLNLSIKTYLIVLYFLRYLSVLVLCAVSLLISKFINKRLLSLTVLIIIGFVPLFLYINNFDFILGVSLFDMISGNLFIKEVFSIAKVLVYLAIFTTSIILVTIKTKD